MRPLALHQSHDGRPPLFAVRMVRVPLQQRLINFDGPFAIAFWTAVRACFSWSAIDVPDASLEADLYTEPEADLDAELPSTSWKAALDAVLLARRALLRAGCADAGLAPSRALRSNA